MEHVENPIVRPIKETPAVGVSFCVHCHKGLFSDEEFLDLEGEHLCDDLCLKDYLGVKRIEGWQVNER